MESIWSGLYQQALTKKEKEKKRKHNKNVTMYHYEI